MEMTDYRERRYKALAQEEFLDTRTLEKPWLYDLDLGWALVG